MMKTDSKGNPMIRPGETIYMLREDAAWVYSAGEVEAVGRHRNREPIGDTLINSGAA